MEQKAYTDSFASIYDDVMGAVPYQLWFNYLHELMDYYQLKPVKILELACGTGNMSFLFQKKGYQIEGIDGSEEMLKIARKKAKTSGIKIKFHFSDLRRFELAAQYDFIFSLFDSLNYILQLDELKQVFKNVYNVLVPDGFFIFDMNTVKRLMSITPGTSMLNGENYTCFWEDIINKEEERWQVRLKIYLDNENDYYEEFHEETAYPRKDIINALREVGFQHIDCFNAYTFERGSDHDNRLYYIAFKKATSARKKGRVVKTLKKIKWRFLHLFISC